MAKPRGVILDSGTMQLVAGLATIVAANIMARLLERGIFDDDDLEFVLDRTATADIGDPALNAMAKAMADMLRSQIITIRTH